MLQHHILLSCASSKWCEGQISSHHMTQKIGCRISRGQASRTHHIGCHALQFDNCLSPSSPTHSVLLLIPLQGTAHLQVPNTFSSVLPVLIAVLPWYLHSPSALCECKLGEYAWIRMPPGGRTCTDLITLLTTVLAVSQASAWPRRHRFSAVHANHDFQ